MSDNSSIGNALASRARERARMNGQAMHDQVIAPDADPAQELAELERATNEQEQQYAQAMPQNGDEPPFTRISRYVWVVTKDKPSITFQGALIGQYGYTDQGCWVELRSASIAEVREDRPGEQYWVGLDGPVLIPWHNISHMYDMPPQQSMRPGAARVTRMAPY